ncbi:hypothetical protein SOV_50410 [Sporomusa ovata DSM 2662]|uniref:Uncharacterized protein n=1 Tax=Sporomusa ovata TaxID=2378 RepID=A0A0U1L0Q1_9FIRM|nr:hypothetical protein SOV_2c03100 [Sporomusa ovata DSM 2662]CQR73258.1 hypothetical protein SpAn4DRAFT_2490 [Sporomusa ovata]
MYPELKSPIEAGVLVRIKDKKAGTMADLINNAGWKLWVVR